MTKNTMLRGQTEPFNQKLGGIRPVAPVLRKKRIGDQEDRGGKENPLIVEVPPLGRSVGGFSFLVGQTQKLFFGPLQNRDYSSLGAKANCFRASRIASTLSREISCQWVSL